MGTRLLRRLGSLALPRLLLGLLAMVIKFSVWLLAAARAGVAVPAFRPQRRGRQALMASGLAAECGGLSDLAGLCDVFLQSADGKRLHAVEDDGTRRVAGRRPIVFVHGFPEMVRYNRTRPNLRMLEHPERVVLKFWTSG
jgi:hypothetical protein